MPRKREPLFHDRQFKADQTSHSTSSNVLVDLVGATLTTKDLDQMANYSVWFSVLISPSASNTTASFTLLAGGVPIAPMARILPLRITGGDVGMTFMGQVEAVSGVKVLQIQWATDKGTITMSEYNLLIDGITEVRILQ